jgi:hypothetical protein
MVAERLPLEGLIVGLEVSRATGKLTVQSEEHGTATIYFLQGHLYHVAGPGGEGDPVLDAVKTWAPFTHTFNAEARLATYENIGAEAQFALKGDESAEERIFVRRRQMQFAVLLVILVIALVLALTHLPVH